MIILFDSLSIFDYIGFAGSAILIFALTLAALVDGFSSGRNFLLLNIVGSTLLLFSDGYRCSYASFGIGVFWIAASTRALANKNVLDYPSLKLFSAVFTICVVGLLYHTAFIAGLSGRDLVIKMGSILIVEVMMLSYLFLIGERIGLALYLAITLATKVLFLPGLMLDENSASIVLHAYGVVIAGFGLARLAMRSEAQLS